MTSTFSTPNQRRVGTNPPVEKQDTKAPEEKRDASVFKKPVNKALDKVAPFRLRSKHLFSIWVEWI